MNRRGLFEHLLAGSVTAGLLAMLAQQPRARARSGVFTSSYAPEALHAARSFVRLVGEHGDGRLPIGQVWYEPTSHIGEPAWRIHFPFPAGSPAAGPLRVIVESRSQRIGYWVTNAQAEEHRTKQMLVSSATRSAPVWLAREVALAWCERLSPTLEH